MSAVTRYHVTEESNLTSILTHGLVPQIGARSAKLGETAGVFLFATRQDAEDGVGSWLGEEFDDDTTLALLEVIVPQDVVEEVEVGWERIVRQTIPAACITLLEMME